MKSYFDKLTEILYDIPSEKRDIKLGKLMTEMEIEYSIPMINDEKYNLENQDIITTYRAISNLRGSQIRMFSKEEVIEFEKQFDDLIEP